MNNPMAIRTGRSPFWFFAVVFFVGLVIAVVFSGKILSALGQWLVIDGQPSHSDAVVILNTGSEWYPRAMSAAALYQKGLAKKVIVNGNRKSDTLRELEKKGFRRCCSWYEDRLRILEVLGVPRGSVTVVSAENAYDTVTEAKAVGRALKETGVESIIVTTSKYHTRRSHHIWKNTYPNQFRITTVAAPDDPFRPKGWWKEGRQIRWVMAEYGAWVYYFWKQLGKIQL